MILAQEIAGIPIALPGWTETVAWLFLALMALAIGVAIWRAIVAQKNRSHLGEIHAKTNLILLMLRNWSENGVISEDASKLRNEHYSRESDYPTDIVALDRPSTPGSHSK